MSTTSGGTKSAIRGQTGKKTKSAARQVERKRITEVEADQRPDWASKLTWEAACDLWYDQVGQYRKSWKDSSRSLELLCILIPPRKKLKDITTQTIAEAIHGRRAIPTGRGNGVPKNSTINRQVVEPAKQVLRRARRVWGARALPIIAWDELRLDQGDIRKRELADAEYHAFFEALSPAHWEPFFKLKLTYGMRIGEMFFHPARVAQIDRRVKIRLKDRKGKGQVRTHYVSLDEEDGALMLARKGRAEAAGLATVWYYEDRGIMTPMTYAGAREAFARAIAKAGIEDLTMHDFRHDAATKITRADGIATAQALLGHADISTTQRYAYVNDEDVIDAVSAVKSRRNSRGRS